VVESVDPLKGGELDGLEAAPGSAAPDQLGLEEAVDRLGERVVVTVAEALSHQRDLLASTDFPTRATLCDSNGLAPPDPVQKWPLLA
jgi:hypothetical protein